MPVVDPVHVPGPRVIVGAPYGFYGGYDGCLVRRLVGTPVGPQFRWANVC
jgi:hypothetical protein